MRKAEIYNHKQLAGVLIEDENGFTFQYNDNYLNTLLFLNWI